MKIKRCSSVGLIMLVLLAGSATAGFALEKAIIIEGRGDYSRFVSFAYQVMLARGIVPENIFCLSDETADLDNDGSFNDIDSSVSNSGINSAITSWASDANVLYLYMVGDGSTGTLRLSDDELLTSHDLDSWLDTLQSPGGCEVVVIYDADKSGSFIPTLADAGNVRIIITSTDLDQPAYFSTIGTSSFSGSFFVELFIGGNIYSSFLTAKKSVKFLGTYDQYAQLEANGNGIPNEKDETIDIRDIVIGNGVVDAPSPEPVSQKAILVAGGGPSEGNIMWPATLKTTRIAYLTLLKHGLSKQNIYVMSDENSDFDENGIMDDVDSDSTNANLYNAITQWGSDVNELVLFLSGHGGDQTFRTSVTENLNASELRSWLDTLQSASNSEVIFIIDSPESASLIPILANESHPRIMIASAGAGESAYYINQGLDSFSRYFWTESLISNDIFQAFSGGRISTTLLTGGYQNPVIDDDNDGIGNEAEDGLYSQRFQFGRNKAIPVERSPQAIIVAGGGPSVEGWDNNIWEETQFLANHAYNALISQGYSDESIHYLSATTQVDFDNDGVVEVDKPATNANLKETIESISAATDSLILYMVDHGGYGTFRMSAYQLLKAEVLNRWLDTLQNSIPGRVTVIYDACQSGSFFQPLKVSGNTKRTMIASTRPEEKADFSAGGDLSFSTFFWLHMSNGDPFYKAFTHAMNAMMAVSEQHPAIDANGDGVWDTKADKELANSIKITQEVRTGDDLPLIVQISPVTEVGPDGSVIIFAERVIDANEIGKVWAVISPPTLSNDLLSEPGTGLVTLDLPYSTANQRYEAVFTDFENAGTYRVSIFAEDINGTRSLPRNTSIIVPHSNGDYEDIYEDDDGLELSSVIVVSDEVAQEHNFHDMGDEDWVSFYGFQGVSYEVRVREPGDFCDAVVNIYHKSALGELIHDVVDWDWTGLGGDESKTFNCPENAVYYVKVSNYLDGNYGRETQYKLKIYRAIGPTPATFTGFVYDSLKGNPIGGAILTTTGYASTISNHGNGTYALVNDHDQATLSISADGYLDYAGAITSSDGESITLNIAMIPQPSLGEVILLLQLVAGYESELGYLQTMDRTGNGFKGLDDAIYVLQILSNVRND